MNSIMVDDDGNIVVPSRFWQRLSLAIVGLLVVLGAAAAVVWHLLHASLATLDGAMPVRGLTAPVLVERDALGVPTIQGTNRIDVARALGVVHAQERFFQMDLMRRRGSGELAALVGSAAVGMDEKTRRHSLRAMATATVKGLPENQRMLLNAYAEGVNAGLAALGAKPPEYFVLRCDPEPWHPEDSLLVGFSMFFTLQEETGVEDLSNEVVARALPPAAADFFFPRSSEWDAAIDGTTFPKAPIPGPGVISFSAVPKPEASAEGAPAGSPDTRVWRDWVRFRTGTDEDAGLVPGSNSWGIQGAASATGAAIVCNDMHLDLGVPNIWFRVAMNWIDAEGRARRLVGASLPGVPTLVVGSNGEIAWGFTNATIDSTDVVVVEVDPRKPMRYRTPDGWRDFENISEVINIRGAPPHNVHYQRTIWGPVVGDSGRGAKYVAVWTPQMAGGADMGLVDMEGARSVNEALSLAPRCGVPVQNFLVGDRSGQLAYTLIGRLPKRVGFDGSVPVSFADGKARWEGWLSPEQTPRFVAPAGGRLWTANNRILGTPEYLSLGTRFTDFGARARQIRDDLQALRAPVAEKDLLGLYRDDRAVFLERWQKLMVQVLSSEPPSTNAALAGRWVAARDAVANWGGHASTGSVGYRLVRSFRGRVMTLLLAPVMDRCNAVTKNVALRNGFQEAPVWAMLEARPAHLLNPRFPSYERLLADAALAVLDELTKLHLEVGNATWGARNVVRFDHPLGRAVPFLSRWLNLDPVSLPGDTDMPRVQGVGFGSSERMIVSPGHEESGVFQMPAGQSGHFLSPFYRAGHGAWLRVEPSPLLPGATQHRLLLQPAS